MTTLRNCTLAPLPAAKQQAAPQRARAEADSDDEVAEPPAKAHRAETAEAEEKDDVPAAAQQPVTQAAPRELPKSLREEYGGLGRENRRRAQRK
jgi:hypothetical protein